MRLKVSFAKSANVHCPLGWTGSSEVVSCRDQSNLSKWATTSRSEPTLAMSLPKDFAPTDLHVLAAAGAGMSGQTKGSAGGAGEFVLISSSDGRFLIVNNKSSRIEKNVLAHNGPIVSGRWSNDASSFLTAGEDGSIKVWSKSGMLRSTVTQSHSHLIPIRFARWSPNSNAILYATDNSLTIKPLAPNSKVIKWTAHEGLVLCAAWCSINGIIASGGEDCRYKVWDSKSGALIYQSPMDEHAIVALDFSGGGDFLLVGSFNLVRLCNATGPVICSSFFNVDNIGSVSSIAWAGDGTQFVAQCGNGSIAFGSIVEQRVISRYLHATLQSRKTILLENIQSKTKDTLEFSDRVTKFDLAYGHLVVALASGQVQVFNESYINTPVYVDGRLDVRIMELGQKTFLLVDNSGVWIYSYAGRLHLNPRYPGYQSQLAYLSKDCISLGINLLAIRDSINTQTIHIFDHLPGATRQEVPHTFQSPTPISMLALSRAATPNDQYLSLVDESGDLYISSVRSPTEFNARKIGSQVTQLMWASETNILVTLHGDEDSYSVWYCPGEAHLIDTLLVAVTTETKELSELGGSASSTRRQANQLQNARFSSFEGSLVTLRNGIVLSVNMYAELLHRFVHENQWTQCLKICRMAQNVCLWGTLAAMACSKGFVDVAEEAFAAIPEVDKVEYLKTIREKRKDSDGGLGQIQANILNGRVVEAETQMINSRHLEDAIRLQCAMFNFPRALKVAEDKLPAMKDLVEDQKNKYKEAVANEVV